MIVQEQYENTTLIRTRSDSGYKIRQIETGVIYDEAIDVPNKYTYEETNQLIEIPEENNENIIDN